MKKFIAIASIAAALSFSACQEKGPLIDFGGASSKTDTTYVETTDTVQKRNVLIEEFTGVSCANCPKGHQAIESIQATYPGQIVAVGLYETGNPNTEANLYTKQILTTVDATTICNSIFGGVNQLPGAGVDRVEGGSPLNIQLDRSIWATQVSSRISVTPPVSLYINSSFDAASSVATVTVRAVFTQAFTKNVRMTVGVIEDSINEAQEDGKTIPVSYDTPYYQNHVLRATISQSTGDVFLSAVASKEVGRVYQRTYTYKVPATWVPKNCQIFAFVQTDDASSKEILQAAETKLQ